MIERARIHCSLFILLIGIIALFSNNLVWGFSPLYDNRQIEKIDVEVINAPSDYELNKQAIIAKLRSRCGDLFSQTDFDNDLKLLAQDFDRVEPVVDVINDNIQIVLKLAPKPRIRAIFWHGNHRITSRCLRDELKITTCSIFDRQEFNKCFHKLKTYYVKKGFFEVELDYEICLDEVSNEADIHITVNEGRAGRIKDILFVNFEPCEEEEILMRMLTKEYCIFLSWLTDQGTYNEDMVQQDQFVILNYLHNRGYSDAVVNIDVTEADSCCDRINLTISADKGQRYFFDKISISGNCIFTEEEVRSRLRIKEGMPYSPELLGMSAQAIQDLYGRWGYIDTYVDFEPTAGCEDFLFNVNFTIEESEQYRVGLVKVIGNCSTETKVILHETLLIPGELFNIEKLKRTEERLRNIGFFKFVNVYAVKTDSACTLGDNYRDVQIEVEETSTGQFGAALGYSSSESLFGSLSITENNFNSKGLGSLFSKGLSSLRGGGEHAFISAKIGTRTRVYSLSWTKPYFMDTKWSVGFDIEQSSTSYVAKDYDINAWGINLRAGYDINAFLRFGWHYRIRDADVHVDHDDKDDELLSRDAKVGGLISATGVALTYNSTDHPTDPTTGFKSRFELEYAGLGGDHHFMSLAYLNAYYIPIGQDQGVLRLRGDWRFIQPMLGTRSWEVPIDERFFLGGDNTVRGYRPYKLGPLYETGGPRGGISMQLYSIEYDKHFTDRIEYFTFFDAAHISLNYWHFGRINMSVGCGLRIKILESTPPLTIGYGVPLNPQYRGQVKRFFLQIGGRF